MPSATLTVTTGHAFRSLERGGWVAAGELRAGERVATDCGARRLRSRTAGAAAAAVYNLEVAGTHSYFVGPQRLWVHNGCELSREAQQLVRQWKQAGRIEGRSLAAFRMGDELRLGSSHYDIIRSFPKTNFSAWEHGYASWINGQWVFRSQYP